MDTAELTPACLACGMRGPPTARFCFNCGAILPASSNSKIRSPFARSPAATHPERRQLTVVFCDLVGSTALARRLDPEDYKDILTAFHRAATGVVEAAGGRIAQYLGDGVLAYFGFPSAAEDDAERAVRASLQLRNVVASLEVDHAPLALRTGIATGLVVVGDIVRSGTGADEQVIAGDTPALAVRLQSIAAAGDVIISHDTRLLVGELFSCRDLGPRELKGFPPSTQAWKVESERAVVSRFSALRDRETPLIGRSDECQLMTRIWQKAEAEQGQVLVVRGESGLGKSRLVAALREIVTQPHDFDPSTQGVSVLEVQGSPQSSNSSLHAVSASIRLLARVTTDQADTILRQQLAGMIAEFGCEKPDETLSAFAVLLDIEPDPSWPALPATARERNFALLDAVQRFIEAMAAARPLLFIVEDVQWLDATSITLMAQLAAWCATKRVAIVVTERTGDQRGAGARSAGVDQTWLHRPHVTVLDLPPLNTVATRALVRAISPDALPETVIDTIVRRSDGVPLFIEEVTRGAIASGWATEKGSQSTERGSIPSTLQGALTARLDQAGPAKEIAQLASIVGREFTLEEIAALLPEDSSRIADAIARLLASRLITTGGAHPAKTFRFRHALIQGAAYSSLLIRRRRGFHRTYAAWLEARKERDRGIPDETIAQHFSLARAFPEAIAARRRGADAAFARGAQADAANLLGDGLLDLAELPASPQRDELELELTMQRATALAAVNSYAWPAVGPLFERARRLSTQLGNSENLTGAEFGLMFHYLIVGNLDRAETYVASLLSRAANAPPALNAYAYMAAGMVKAQQSSYADACFNLEQCVRLTEQHGIGARHLQPGIDLWTFSRIYLAYMLAFRSRSDDGRALMGEVLDKYRHDAGNSANAFGYGLTLLFACKMHLLMNDHAAVSQCSEELKDVAKTHRYPYFADLSELMSIWARGAIGTDAGLRAATNDLATALTQQSKSSDVIGLQIFHLKLAEMYIRLGEKDNALRSLNHTLQTATQKYNVWHSESRRIMSQVLLMSPHRDPKGAELLCRQAITVAAQQGAATLEVRAGIMCAEILLGQARRPEARAILLDLSDRLDPASTDAIWHQELLKASMASDP